jgi:poly(3-hydroxybutyrate) depolymerase
VATARLTKAASTHDRLNTEGHQMERMRVRRWAPAVVSLLFVFALPGIEREAAAAQAQETGFVNRVFRDSTGEHRYALFIPRGYRADRKWPVILYLHGAGERGTDGVAPTSAGIGPFVRARAANFPFFVVFPQCEDTRGAILTAWSSTSADGSRALAILASIEKEFSIDTGRRVLTGWSMGGYGTWSLGSADPQRWSALVPVAGGGDPAWAPRLKNTPIWAAHGVDDDVVRVVESRRMIEAIRAAGGRPLYSELAAGHDVWKTFYNDDRLYQWMLEPALAPARSSVGGSASREAGPRERAVQPDLEGPFVPAVTIPNAMSVRLGNDMLKALALSVPRMIPPDALRGGINDIFQTTTASGRSFSVQFSRIGYSGQVERAFIKAYARDRLNIQLALRNVNLVIGSTYVQGSGRSAVAGPIWIVIGHRYPVWLSFDVTPYVRDGRLRFQVVATRFDIPGDNWYVTRPYGVSTRGLGMTEELVSDSLVEGIYGQKYRIEREALAIIPALVSRLEERLDLAEVSDVANAFWPLPVYRPRVKVWPQQVAVDDKGVSLVVGVVAAAVDPRKAPRRPRVEPGAGISLGDVPHSTQLTLGVAPGVLEPLSRLLIDADVARVNVLDVPGRAFASFADRKALSEALPGLAQVPPDSQISAELILASPIQVRDAGQARAESPPVATRTDASSGNGRSTTVLAARPALEARGDRQDGSGGAAGSDGRSTAGQAAEGTAQPRPFEFIVPKAVIAISIKEAGQDARWKPYAELEFELLQRATASVERRGFSERLLEIAWTGEPAIKASGRFSSGRTPSESEIHEDKLRHLVSAAWKNWTQSGPASRVSVPDVDFGYSKLRMDSAAWTPPVLSVGLDDPGIKITNATDDPQVYELKGAYSAWSGPLRLAPGKSHEYDVAEPLLFRRRLDGSMQVFTLPVGYPFAFKPSPGKPAGLFRVRESAAAP